MAQKKWNTTDYKRAFYSKGRMTHKPMAPEFSSIYKIWFSAKERKSKVSIFRREKKDNSYNDL